MKRKIGLIGFSLIFLFAFGCSYNKYFISKKPLHESITPYIESYWEKYGSFAFKYRFLTDNNKPLMGYIVMEFKNKKNRVRKINKSGFVQINFHKNEYNGLKSIFLKTREKKYKMRTYFSCFIATNVSEFKAIFNFKDYKKYKFKKGNVILYSKNSIKKEQLQQFEKFYQNIYDNFYDKMGIRLGKIGFIYKGPLSFVQTSVSLNIFPYYPNNDFLNLILMHEVYEDQLTGFLRDKGIDKIRLIGDGLTEYLRFLYKSKNWDFKQNFTKDFNDLYKKYGNKTFNVLNFSYSDIVKQGLENSDSLVYLLGPYFWGKLIYKSKKKDLLKKFFMRIHDENSINERKIIKILSEVSGIDLKELKKEANISLFEFKENADKYLPIYILPNDMVSIPKGEYIIGRENKETKLKSFLIDKYEVSNKKYCLFLNMVKDKMSVEFIAEKYINFGTGICKVHYDYKGKYFFVEEGYNNYPITEVSWIGAEAYAKWAGKRLPTEKEWEAAARGSEGFIYPWGNEWDPKRCNWKEDGKIDGYKFTAPINSFNNGISPFGCYNMAGNVWEWVDSEKDGYKIHKGGCYKYSKNYQRTYEILLGKPDGTYPCVGFRCVKDIDIPENKK